jgi:hypothetical protein
VGGGERSLKLKRLIEKRIVHAFKRAELPIDLNDPWRGLVGEDSQYRKTSFKYILNQTMFRPRDLLLFFKPLEEGTFTYPLERDAVSSLASRYSEELAKELKSELTAFHNQTTIETIFQALGEMARNTATTYDDAVTSVGRYCVDVDARTVLEYLFDRSLIGNLRTEDNWYTFKCRVPEFRSASVRFDASQSIVVQYGLRTYLMSRAYMPRK